MSGPSQPLRDDALQIWQAGVDAVDSARLVRQAVHVEGQSLRVGQEVYDLQGLRRILVVGAGKAGAGMAQGLEEALGPRLLAEKQVTGWLNVPADCVRPLAAVHLHAARLPGQNEPTAEGVAGAEAILRMVAQATSDDLCIALISGGGSALLPAPAQGISLADKLAVTRHLSASGANIRELNTVRKQLSRIKGGGLSRACRAGHLATLVISDVLGDPLDIIASGPTVEDPSTPADALKVLEQFDARAAGISNDIFEFLQQSQSSASRRPSCRVTNQIIGNNQTAVDAAASAAARLGYDVTALPTEIHEGTADEMGRKLANAVRQLSQSTSRSCLVSGGEPVVKLAPLAERGLGGRNQQLVLAAAADLAQGGLEHFALLSGGTDGEDGPTDAAGAVLDSAVLDAARKQSLAIHDYLRRNDAYHFFAALGALIKTGPTHTNVCDLRVAVVAPRD